MAVWKLARLNRVSAATGLPFPPDTEVVTVLFGEEEEELGEDRVRGTGFVRKDFLPDEATDEVLAGAFCVWRTRTPPADPGAARRLDLDMARAFLERLLDEGRSDRAAVMLTLALLLIRKRRLNLIRQAEDVLEVRWPREKAVFPVPAPHVTEADAEALQQELQRLFDIDAGATEAEATGGGDASAEAAADGESAAGESADGESTDGESTDGESTDGESTDGQSQGGAVADAG